MVLLNKLLESILFNFQRYFWILILTFLAGIKYKINYVAKLSVGDIEQCNS